MVEATGRADLPRAAQRPRQERRTVVFVGRRRRAFAAARTLDLDFVCVDERPPDHQQEATIARFVRCRLTGGGTDWSEVAARAAAGRKIAAIFALTEGAVLPAARLRERLGIAGDGPAVAERCTDKLKMKRAMVAAGVPCAPFVDAGRGLDGDALAAELGLPLVFKGRVGSGGRRTRFFHRRSEFVGGLAPGWMAEGFVDGVEMSVESLVAGGRPVFTNPTEYFRVRWANIAPAELPADTWSAVAALNSRALAALGIETAFTHLELFLTPAGPVFGELALRPPGGRITDLIELAYGFDPWRAWLQLGLGGGLAPPPAAGRTAGVWLLHPGPGAVASVAGVEEARTVEGVERVRLRLRPGTAVAERVGSGQEVGHILLTGRDRDQVAERLERARGCLRIDMEPRSDVGESAGPAARLEG